MKIRRADKRYQPRHGGTWADDLRMRAPEFGNALVWLAVIGVAGVTGYFLHDDLIETARSLSDGSPAGMAAAGWAIVAVSTGTSAACLFAVTRSEHRSRALLLSLYAGAVVAAFPTLWFLPRRYQEDYFGAANADLITGTRLAWLALMLGGFTVIVSALVQTALRITDRWPHRWVLGTAAVIASIAALTLVGAVVSAG
jgi:hypothetical protein